MDYIVQSLAALSGVSRRTLRYYDQIGLLKPARVAENGYRIYGKEQVERLQQILLYRALGMKLEEIQAVLSAPDFDACRALEEHLCRLEEKKQQIEKQIQSVRKTLSAKKGDYIMKDAERFEGFKEEMIRENEAKYGSEIRQKYGEEAVDASIFKVRGMSEERWQAAEALRTKAEALFGEAMREGDPKSETARQACAVHGEWIRLFWKDGTYLKAAHAALGEMYAADPRFRAYYEKQIGEGAAEFLRDALAVYAQTENMQN